MSMETALEIPSLARAQASARLPSQNRLLAGEPPMVARERAGAAEHPVAGDHEEK